MTQQKKKEIAERLAKITAANAGLLTPNAVVADAEDPTSPLHDQFEWDDKVAGHLHRLDQARALINTVKVLVNVLERTFATPRYVRDPRLGNAQQGYVEVATVKSEKSVARDMLANEMARITAAIERARGLAAALDLADEFEAMLVVASAINEKLAA